MAKAYMLECPPCNFLVRSHDQNEVVDLAQIHIKGKHADMAKQYGKDKIKSMVKSA
ncbi:MAG: hypothetical protein AABX59_00940 [Nanoarchaeota archaeon]